MVFDKDGGIDATREKKIDQNSNQKMDSSYQESTNYSIERSCESDRRVEFSMVSVPECFIKSELFESIEMLSNQEGRPKKLLEQPLTATLTTDAAESGWGSTLVTPNIKLMDAGKWSNNWHLSSSNQRETAAVLISLRSLADTLNRLAWRGDYMINPLILQEKMQILQFYPQLDAFSIRITKQFFKKLKMEPATALFILPKWSLDKFRTLVPTIISEIDLGKVEMILEKGKTLQELNLRLPQGNLSALLLTSIQLENSYIENWRNQLDLNNKQYIND
ncbi:MAG: hypothetical protein EZS28_005101 [Streblomastix strix]|uniref:Uncharacterized protein n=1 Tax=Streblomastix strix TaxID=222440 RepID=A0A5J4WWR5_9EUKA|nr:MAG: hypothetical protein EZS28_005101 [Streblomastix strix]